MLGTMDESQLLQRILPVSNPPSNAGVCLVRLGVHHDQSGRLNLHTGPFWAMGWPYIRTRTEIRHGGRR